MLPTATYCDFRGGLFFDFWLRPFSSESKTFRRSLRLRKHTLRAIRPTAITKTATAATDSPAIWAGVILRGWSATTGSAVKMDEGDDVAEGMSETESAMADWVDIVCVWSVFVIEAVATDPDEEDNVDDVADIRGAPVATTVRAVLVGVTASRCSMQTLYTAGAACSALGQFL